VKFTEGKVFSKLKSIVLFFQYTVTCRGVRVTKIMGSRSDDWIYWHLDYNFS
jgi:hypothetical protein